MPMTSTDAEKQLANSGWKLDHMSTAQVERSHHFYLVEPEKQTHCQIVMAPIEAFNALSPGNSAEQYVNYLNHALLGMRVKASELTPEQFTSILIAYFKCTETYKMARERLDLKKPLSILINLYGEVGSPSTAIRPVIFAPTGLVASPKEAKEIAKEVYDIDRVDNPHYFEK